LGCAVQVKINKRAAEIISTIKAPKKRRLKRTKKRVLED